MLGVGFLWAATHAHLSLIDRSPPVREGKDLRIEAVIASVPRAFARGERFEANADQGPWRGSRRLRLSWYGPHPPIALGERWQLTVRLRRPVGRANPHGFDYERWLFTRGIYATGYVRPGYDNRRLAEHPSTIEFSIVPLLLLIRVKQSG